QHRDDLGDRATPLSGTQLSSSMRSYRLCTRFDETPHVGQLAEVDNGDARIRTPPAVALTESMSTPDR
ncbi:hypothetical protein, partial [Rhodococcus sp. UFZ-B548]|uniref:hypothetical protein n=1 Tax=Rhodococcus sp. UFZ-B548 TaxID=2742212 RepID=UPI001C70D376